MKQAVLSESEIIEIVVYSCLTFVLMGLVLILFFYFSRKKIIQKELEKKDLEIQYQKELLSAVILTQEEERKRIAQDLHDDISSKLNIVSLNSHLLKTPELSDAQVEDITATIIELTAKALDNSRKIAHNLLPPVLDKFGLQAGIEELCEEFSSSKAVKVNFTCNTSFDLAENDRYLHVFRILQELMNNSLRHGKATQIDLVLDEKNGKKHGFYSDNGVGFDHNLSEHQKGLGMKNIESRVAFLNGNFHLKSKINEGIQVDFNF